MTTQCTPLGAIARGLVAGAAGTGAMTAAQELTARLQSSDDGGPASGDEQPPRDPWEQASTPAKVARRISEGVFEHPVPPGRIPLLTHVMHWAYGTGWGGAYGAIERSIGGGPARRGLLFGAGVWAMAYVQLVPMGLYRPPWKYAPKDVATELGFHLVYGLGVAGAHGVLSRH